MAFAPPPEVQPPLTLEQTHLAQGLGKLLSTMSLTVTCILCTALDSDPGKGTYSSRQS